MNRYQIKISRGIALLLALFLLAPGIQAQTNAAPEAIPSFSTNSYWMALPIDPAIYSTPYHLSLFRPKNGEDGARAWSQTKSVFFYGLGVFGVLAVMPESMTGWEKSTDIFSKWVDNVTSGPVWDRDNPIYNYAGHTYSGGVYYQVARKSGYRQWDAFVYTFLMSTFYWEYGVEAFAEVPSIQDLVVTPVLGWVYGEWAYQTEHKIRENGNDVAGSRILGNISLFMLDPIDSLGRGVNRLVGRRWIKAGNGYFSYTAAPTENDGVDHTVYLNMQVPIGGSTEPKIYKASQFKGVDDPVDTGIVGFSVGGGYVFVDDQWGLENGSYDQFSLGLYLTPRFSGRVRYARGHLDKRDGSTESVIYENYSLDGQYYFGTHRKLRPFVTAGFGEQMWNKNEDKDLHQKFFQLNGGLGLHWQVFKKIALQADWVNYYSFETETYDQNLNVAFIYRFGRGEHSNW